MSGRDQWKYLFGISGLTWYVRVSVDLPGRDQWTYPDGISGHTDLTSVDLPGRDQWTYLVGISGLIWSGSVLTWSESVDSPGRDQCLPGWDQWTHLVGIIAYLVGISGLTWPGSVYLPGWHDRAYLVGKGMRLSGRDGREMGLIRIGGPTLSGSSAAVTVHSLP